MALFHPLKFMLASPAEDAAEIIRRLGPDRLGRGQVRRHPVPAPPARRRGPALLARPPRHQRRSSPRSSTGARGAALGRDPRRRDPRLARRRRPAVPPAPGAARAQEPVGEDPRGDPGDLRRLGRARARTRDAGHGRRRRCSSEPLTRAPPAARGAGPAARRATAAGSRSATSSSVDSVDGLEAAFAEARARRNEGLMVKDPTSGYSPGPPRARLAEDEEGAGDARLRGRRRRGRPRQAPRRPVATTRSPCATTRPASS